MPVFVTRRPFCVGADGLYEAAMAAPQATIIASHLDAVNHARLGARRTAGICASQGAFGAGTHS